MPYDAVLLIAFGGPTAPEDVRPFLENVTRGRGVPPERLALVEQQYARIGGRSPLKDLTMGQARALEAMLAASNRRLPVRVGMRNWHPYLHETLADLARQGARRVLGIILSSLRSEPSWERYIEDVRSARAQVPSAPEVDFAPPWTRHPGFIDAVADRARLALHAIPESERTWVPLVFTAHSLPVAVAETSPYVGDLSDAAHAVAERLGHPRYSIAYQSRSGRPDDPWLEPDVNDVLQRLGADRKKHVVVVPIGFVVDHVEVLYDLDVRARATAEAAGIALHRATAVNDHPRFIAAMTEIVASHTG
jgi:protoporphyrin/coproporphyrin ferrochelatase